MNRPEAERGPVVEELHGHRVADPYRWLEDPDAPATRAWLDAQDAAYQDDIDASLRDAFRERLVELADTGTVSAPVWRGERRFTLRRAAGQEHAVLSVADGGGAPRTLVDPAAIDPSGGTTLDAWRPDPSGRLLACQLSQGGTERAELYVLDVETGEAVDGPLDRCRYSPVAWLPDGSGFYYVRAEPDDEMMRRVRLHLVGEPPEHDTAVTGPAATHGVGISEDGRWLVVSTADGVEPRNDLFVADLASGDLSEPRFRVVQKGVDARAAAIVGRDGRLYIVTDLHAPRVRLCVADPSEPDVWTDLIPEDEGAVLTDFTLLNDLVAVTRVRQGTAELTLHDALTGKRVSDIPLPGPGVLGPLAARPGGGHELWFTHSGIVTPETVWHYDTRTGTPALWEASPGSPVLPPIETHHLTCTSADGTPVRITIIARPDGAEDGPRPAILYGYGGFGIPVTPTYAADSLAWVESGGVLAIAHLRGGGEDGTASHRAGMLGKKQRVFDDFLAVAERLVADGWTAPDRLAIWGESNGGLLVGAALTQRPDLFAAAVCVAPLLDMLRYDLSGMGAAWHSEYGSPADAEAFEWLHAYSPYHRVRQGVDYPATLFAVFDGDSRVDPLHARKMCAAMQWASAGDRPVLLRREAGVGHAARSVGRSFDLASELLAFVARHTSAVVAPT
ncbi:prolyl oligopeptidase family serine peptidase [Actinomadura rupiterrae]|uniref:prolyl oligopeptidase family serine peptidase n=1 Tax=Actinomadura rupiterrae TaxID=559627 RepID=UPI0020A535CE|nr:prolyl oligopeptidase family serine peptidase [Actinomadura rupiterrae]MCP2337637.1 prolyl oligopeptidase [Actinomadura rupiterrae]